MRILQISDLHLAETSARRGQLLSAEQPFMQSRMFRGYLAHDRNALRELSALVRHRLADKFDYLVVSGDITCAGTAGDMDFACQFLSGSGPVVGPGRLEGLGNMSRHVEEGWRRVSVLGNHDLWGRYASGRADLPHFDRAVHVQGALHAAPWVHTLGDLGGGISLVLAGIDSNDETTPVERLLAIGSFARQCRLLDVMMQSREPASPREVRVLVLHHDPTVTGIVKGITRESRAALEKLVAEQRFHVVLSGHSHATSELAALRQRTLYVRCGTTTQKLTLRASDLRTSEGPVRGDDTLYRVNRANIALLHDVEAVDARTVRWSFTTYARGGRGRPFAEAPELSLGTPHLIRL